MNPCIPGMNKNFPLRLGHDLGHLPKNAKEVPSVRKVGLDLLKTSPKYTKSSPRRPIFLYFPKVFKVSAKISFHSTIFSVRC